MSFVADAVGKVGDVIGGVMDSIADNPAMGFVSAVGTMFGAPTFAIEDAAAGAAAEATAVAADSFSFVSAADVLPSTWAEFGATSNTLADIVSANSTMLGASATDLAGLTAATDAVVGSTALSSIAPAGVGMWETVTTVAKTAADVAKGAKTAMNVVQLVNNTTQERTLVPANAPVPTGWAIDSRYGVDLSQPKFNYDPATGQNMQIVPDTSSQSTTSSSASISPLWIVMGIALVYLAGKH